MTPPRSWADVLGLCCLPARFRGGGPAGLSGRFPRRAASEMVDHRGDLVFGVVVVHAGTDKIRKPSALKVQACVLNETDACVNAGRSEHPLNVAGWSAGHGERDDSAFASALVADGDARNAR